MNTIHICKTKTSDEYDPSTHPAYRQLLMELQGQEDTLSDARKSIYARTDTIVRQQGTDFILPLYKNIFGLYLCDVKVNGTPCRFIIDSGAQLSSIRHDAMKRLNIEQTSGSVEIGSAAGTRKLLNGCVLNSFTFGTSIYEHLPVLCLDKDDFSLQFGTVDIFQFDGILGWDILRDYDFEFDTIARQFKVLKNRFKFRYQNMVSGMFPIFLVQDHAGNLLKMGFDSGSRRSWFSQATANRLQYKKNGEIQAIGFGVHGAEKMDLVLYDKVSFSVFKATVTIRNLMSGNCKIMPDISCDGVFGNEIFKNRRIRIINSKGMVLLV